MSEVVLVQDVAEAHARALPYLAADPVRRNIPATVLEAMHHGEMPPGDVLFCLSYDDTGAVDGLAMHTPPHRLVVTELTPGAVTGTVDLLLGIGRELPGVTGPDPAAGAFAELWAQRTGVRADPGHDLGVLELRHLIRPVGIPGRLRRVQPADHPLVRRWAAAFGVDAGLSPTDRQTVAERILERPGLWLWDCDDEPVCLVGNTLPGAGVARVGPVYTPPQYRRRRYASAATAAVSRILQRRLNRVMLFTDLANPTSNAIYLRLGYRQVARAREINFAPP